MGWRRNTRRHRGKKRRGCATWGDHRVARFTILLAMLGSVVCMGAHVLPSSAAPGRAERSRLANDETHEAARQLLVPRRSTSTRAARAREVRQLLVEVRREVAALEAAPSAASAARIGEARRRLARVVAGRSGVGEVALHARSDSGPGAEMAALLEALDAVARNPGGRRDDLPRIADLLDRALTAPPGEASVRRLIPLVPADTR